MSEATPMTAGQKRRFEFVELRKAKKAANRLERALQLKDGTKPCKWSQYGCPEFVKLPLPAKSSVVEHEVSCAYKCERKNVYVWKEVKRSQEKGSTAPKIGQTLAGLIKTFKHVKAWEPGQLVAQEPLLFGKAEFWEQWPGQGDLYSALVSLEGNDHVIPKGISVSTIARQTIFHDHKPEDVQMLLGMEPQAFAEKFPITLPPSFDTSYTVRNGFSTLDVTPTFSFEDLNAGKGFATLAIHHGDLRKLWLLWPPTDENEDKFYTYASNAMLLDEADQRSDFERIAPLLTGGLAVIASSKALFIPPGWIRITYTTRGGYLPTYIFCSRETIENRLRCLGYELSHNSEHAEMERTIRFVQDSINMIMRSTDGDRVIEGVQHWIRLIGMVQEATIQRNIQWSVALKEHTNDIVETLVMEPMVKLPEVCYCGEEGRGLLFFRMHFIKHKLG